MASAPVAQDSSRRILELARRDRSAASAALGALSLEDQVALICDSPVAQRAELLALSAEPEALVPCIPEAELCFTVKAVGLADAEWILAHATADQVITGVDLDVWNGYDLDTSSLGEWLDALARTPRATLLRSVRSLDAELLARLLRTRLEVVMKPSGDDDWQQPEGTQTLEGQFFFKARAEGDDLESLVATLQVFFEEDYWSYFRMMQSVIWELDSDLEEFALRWRTGRLQDLGFPPRDEALSIYRYLDSEQRLALSSDENALDVSEWQLPVWLPQLPASVERHHRLFAAIAELEPEERRGSFYAFVAVANKVAVADRMELSDAESTPRAIEKAAELISRGLEHVASHHAIDDPTLLRRAPLEWLFSVGANLEPDEAQP
jgi:hypothetical protein